MRLVVIDDQPLVALDLAAVLEDFGHEVEIVASLADLKRKVAGGYRPEGALCDGYLSVPSNLAYSVFQVREYLETVEGFRMELFVLYTSADEMFAMYGERFPGAARFRKSSERSSALGQFDCAKREKNAGETRVWN